LTTCRDLISGRLPFYYRSHSALSEKRWTECPRAPHCGIPGWAGLPSRKSSTSRFWETVACAFLSCRTVPATGRRYLRGAIFLSVRLRPLESVPHMTFWSGLRSFGLKRQTFLRRLPPELKVRRNRHHRYLSLTHVGISVYYSPVSRRFKIAYNKALALEQKTTSSLNTLFQILDSWAAVTDGPPGDALLDVVTLDQLSEVK
jgi:hypothetical protein